MKVYELQHICDGAVRALGFYSSLKKRDEAIEKYRKTEELRDYPMSFVTFEHNIYDGKAVYLAQVLISCEDSGFAYAKTIGVFAREADADKAVQSFIERNRGNLEDEALTIELAIDTYRLDEMQEVE